MPPKPLIVLGLETSCDETAAAVVRGLPPGPGEILSNVMFSQVAQHRPYGGVVPEIAARAHVELLDGVIARALDQAGIALGDVDAIAATAGPGLIGGVMVGLVSAKALALASGKPLIAVNHLEAHALSARLSAGTEFPFLLLLISGVGLWFVESIPWSLRWLRYLAVTVHVIAALATIGGFIIHVYMGTAMVRGGFTSIVRGEVTADWARSHHRLWYEQVTKGGPREK